MTPTYRRTRFVCVSDTHNQTPKLPAGDVLLHAGDLTKQGSYAELRRTVEWLEKADFETKIVVAGNHDITLDANFYAEHGAYFHHRNPQSPSDCLALLTSSPSITYLNHESRNVRLTSPTGPRTCFRVFGSPYSPAAVSTAPSSSTGSDDQRRQRHDKWAFQYPACDDSSSAAALWSQIPVDADVVLTHAPPRHHLDASTRPSPTLGRARGCEELRRALWRVRPRLAVCGHCHEGRGAERLTWRVDLPRCPYMEESTEVWEETNSGGKGLAKVDLTGRRGGRRLDWRDEEADGAWGLAKGCGGAVDSDGMATVAAKPASQSDREVATALAPTRTGRRETCIVNAAITGASHGMPARFNKPIVVDLDLPVLDDDDGAG